MRDRIIFFVYFCHKVIRWFFLDFSEIDLASNLVYLVLNCKALELLDSTCSEKRSAELIGCIGCLYDRAIFELKFSLALISDGERVHSRTDFDIIISAESVALLRSIYDKVADWRVV